MTDQPTPQTEALSWALREHRDRNEPPCESCITRAAQARTEALDVDALADALHRVDTRHSLGGGAHNPMCEARAEVIAREYALIRAAKADR